MDLKRSRRAWVRARARAVDDGDVETRGMGERRRLVVGNHNHISRAPWDDGRRACDRACFDSIRFDSIRRCFVSTRRLTRERSRAQ